MFQRMGLLRNDRITMAEEYYKNTTKKAIYIRFSLWFNRFIGSNRGRPLGHPLSTRLDYSMSTERVEYGNA